MALALKLRTYASVLTDLYEKLHSDGDDKIILTGKNIGIEDLTWIAKKSSGRAIVDGEFDFTILWEDTNVDIKTLDERLACKLSALSPPDEWEFDNIKDNPKTDARDGDDHDKKDNTEEDKEKRNKKLLEDHMSEVLEGKKVLLIFVDEASKMEKQGMEKVSQRIKELKANCKREMIITTAYDNVEDPDPKRVIKVGPENDQISEEGSLYSWRERIYETLGLQSKLLLENILIDFCSDEHKFPFKHGSVHYSELITYWILEGVLGPFDCFENAYEKGHHVLMALAHHGFIEKLQAGHVTKNGKKLFLSARDHCGMEETVHLHLATVLERDLGRIAQADGKIRTLGNVEEMKKSSTLLIDGNSLSREFPDDLFHSSWEIEALAIFNLISEPELLSLEMPNLRLLMLRGCDFLRSFENLLKPGSTVPAENTSFQKLSVLEISGPSSLEAIPDNLFEHMPHIQNLNLSSLLVTSLPSSLYHLEQLIRLVLRGCSKLEKIGSLRNMAKLQVLDLSGATSLEKFHDKSFLLNKELLVLNLSKTNIKTLPLINDLGKLTYLLLRDCKSLSRLRMICSLRNLKILDLSGAKDFVEFPDQSLENLGSLEEINVSHTQIEKLPSDICNIRRLSLRGCSKLKEFPHLKNPDHLELLDLSATGLISVPSLSNLSKLRELFLSGCKALSKLPDNSFENMHCLQKLDLSETNIKHLPSLSYSSKLHHLFLHKCTNLEVFPSLEFLADLKELNLSGLKCKGKVDFDFLKCLVNLQHLDISETEVTHLPALSNLKKLKNLYLRGCQNLTEVPKLETTLEVLDLSGSSVVDLPSFQDFGNLCCLLLRNCPKVKEFKKLEISEVVKGSIEELPYSISELTCLNHLELPKMKSGENGNGNRTEELLHYPWRISSWPLKAVSSSHMRGVYVDNFQVLQLLEKNSLDCRSVHFLVHPVEAQTKYCCSRIKKQTGHGRGKYLYQNELLQRETFFKTRKLCQCKEQGKECQCRKLERSLEICGFSDYPPGLERLAAHAEFLFLIDNQFMKSLSSLGAESMKKMKYCWIEGCCEMESILSGEEMADNLSGSKDQRDSEEIIELFTGIGCSLEILRVFEAVSLKNIYNGNLQGHGLRLLKCLYLEHCPELASVCYSSHCVENLQILQIKFCNKFRTLFEDARPSLPKLHTLYLWALPNLEPIACQLPSLQTLIVGECPMLTSVISSNLHSETLEILQISLCDHLKTVVADNQLKLPKLREMHLQDLPELREIVAASDLQLPGKIFIRGCPNHVENKQLRI